MAFLEGLQREMREKETMPGTEGMRGERVRRSWRSLRQVGDERKRKFQTCEEVERVLGWDLLLALIQFLGSGVDGKAAKSEVLRSPRCTHSHTHMGTGKQSPQCGEGPPSQ